ncbi:brain acid soluble protein 1-like protein [Lates japonicus]|uniref:Brain acid soluble protein 1-like protein n=1 Tax=Lates japonicus TaxID=270547 RepID=A0AAD3RAN3_LATJO|nr:brain acid soluble protein 1-like protein [Lates japonicus]
MPDLLTAVKILAGSTVEIAAASVGETSLVNTVRQIEEDGKGLQTALEMVEPDVLAKEAAEEAAVAVSEEELKSAEDGAAEGVTDVEAAEAPSAEEVASAPAAAEEEEAAAAPPEEATASASTVERVGDEDEAPVAEAAPEEAVSSTEAPPEDSADEVSPAEEAIPSSEEITPAAETSVEEGASEASAEDAAEVVPTHSEAAAVVYTTQLAAASTATDLEVLSTAEPESTSEAPVHEAKHCHSCHSVPSAREEVVPPAALGGELVSEGAVDITHEAKEEVSLVEGQSKNI